MTINVLDSPDSMLTDKEAADGVPLMQCLRLLLLQLPTYGFVTTILLLQPSLVSRHYLILSAKSQK